MTADAPSVGRQVRDVGRSVRALAAGELVNKVARFLAAVVLARSLPLDEFGLLNIGIALGGIATVLMRFGLPDLGARDVAARPGDAASLAGRVVAPQAVGMLVLIAVASVVVALVEPDAVPFAVMSGASMLGLSLSGDWLLRGLQRMTAVAVATALGGVVVLAAAVLVTLWSESAVVALGAFALGEAVAALATWRSSGIARRVRPTLRGAGALLRRAWPLAASGVIVYAFYANVDTLILAAVRSPEEAGLYSGPYRVFLALNAVVLFAGQALLPVVTRAVTGSGGAAGGAAVVRGCVRPLLVYGLVCLGVVEAVGRPALGVLFGDEFREAGSTFVLLALAVPWYAIGFPAGYALIATERSRSYLRGAALAGVVNIALNVALIPPLGITGAALATVVGFGAGSLLWLHEQRLLAELVPTLVVLFLASAAAAVVVLTEEFEVVAGLATVAVALALLVTDRDLDLLRRPR